MNRMKDLLKKKKKSVCGGENRKIGATCWVTICLYLQRTLSGHTNEPGAIWPAAHGQTQWRFSLLFSARVTNYFPCPGIKYYWSTVASIFSDTWICRAWSSPPLEASEGSSKSQLLLLSACCPPCCLTLGLEPRWAAVSHTEHVVFVLPTVVASDNMEHYNC